MSLPTPARVLLRLPKPLKILLEEAAKRENVSMNAEIVRRLEQSFSQDEVSIDSTRAGVELFKALRELDSVISDRDDPRSLLSVQRSVLRALEAIFPLPPGKKLATPRFEGDRIVSDLIVDADK
jgi:hypothetical protein